MSLTLLAIILASAVAANQCIRPPSAIACGSNNATCAFGAVCVSGRCQGGPQGHVCNADEDCDGIFVDGLSYLCLNETCGRVSLPGDPCSEQAPCVGTCEAGRCEALKLGDSCDRTVDCGIVGFCEANKCIDVAFLGEKCPEGRCQNAAYCQDGSCIPLFLRPNGQNCSYDNECLTSSLCVNNVCDVVAPDYGLPCPCKAPLVCVEGICRYGSNDESRLIGCREELRESLLCSSRQKCFEQATDSTSCSVERGCFHEVALLRNCLFCNNSVPEIVRSVRPCIADVCLDPGLSHLIKVSIGVGIASFALIVASAIIHAIQVRRARNIDKYTKM